MPQKVGFIGLGAMGRPFATNIAQAGFDLIVHDLRPQPVAHRSAATILCQAEVAELADAPDSKSGVRKDVWVRPPPSALDGYRDFARRGRTVESTGGSSPARLDGSRSRSTYFSR